MQHVRQPRSRPCGLLTSRTRLSAQSTNGRREGLEGLRALGASQECIVELHEQFLGSNAARLVSASSSSRLKHSRTFKVPWGYEARSQRKVHQCSCSERHYFAMIAMDVACRSARVLENDKASKRLTASPTKTYASSGRRRPPTQDKPHYTNAYAVRRAQQSSW